MIKTSRHLSAIQGQNEVIFVYLRKNMENTTRKYKLSRLRSVLDQFDVGCAVRTEWLNATLTMVRAAHPTWRFVCAPGILARENTRIKSLTVSVGKAHPSMRNALSTH